MSDYAGIRLGYRPIPLYTLAYLALYVYMLDQTDPAAARPLCHLYRVTVEEKNSDVEDRDRLPVVGKDVVEVFGTIASVLVRKPSRRLASDAATIAVIRCGPSRNLVSFTSRVN